MKFFSCILLSSQFVMFSPVMASTFKVVCDDKSKPFLLFFNSNLHSVEHEKLKKSIIKNISCPKGSKGRLLLSKNIKNSIYMKITVNKFPIPSHNRGGISFSLFLNSENVSYYYKKFPQLGASSFRQNLSGDISYGTAKLWEKLDAGPLLNGRNEESSS